MNRKDSGESHSRSHQTFCHSITAFRYAGKRGVFLVVLDLKYRNDALVTAIKVFPNWKIRFNLVEIANAIREKLVKFARGKHQRTANQLTPQYPQCNLVGVPCDLRRCCPFPIQQQTVFVFLESFSRHQLDRRSLLLKKSLKELPNPKQNVCGDSQQMPT